MTLREKAEAAESDLYPCRDGVPTREAVILAIEKVAREFAEKALLEQYRITEGHEYGTQWHYEQRETASQAIAAAEREMK